MSTREPAARPSTSVLSDKDKADVKNLTQFFNDRASLENVQATSPRLEREEKRKLISLMQRIVSGHYSLEAIELQEFVRAYFAAILAAEEHGTDKQQAVYLATGMTGHTHNAASNEVLKLAQRYLESEIKNYYFEFRDLFKGQPGRRTKNGSMTELQKHVAHRALNETGQLKGKNESNKKKLVNALAEKLRTKGRNR